MYAERRRKLLDEINDGVAIFCASPESIRNDDVHHDYRQDSDLYYLTGFEEPECVLILVAQPGAVHRSILFLRERDPQREIWDGYRLGVDDAPSTLGIDEARSITGLDEQLTNILVGARHIYYDLGRQDREANDALVVSALTKAKRSKRRDNVVPETIRDAAPYLHEMRLVKADAEIEIMREAAALTSLGHQRAMAVTRPGLREYQVEAAMEYEWRVRGAARNAYPSIVGSGPNACVLHYRAGERVMGDHELVLVDAGCEKGYYASDVTRTWPVSGKFTPEQRELYDIVLEAELACIDHCKVGETLDGIHHVALRTLIKGLLKLGFLSGTVEEIIADESYRRYYMHRTSHWIGMDVHDVGDYQVDGQPRQLKAGMVLTVEPGLYIPVDDDSVPEAYRGIGIRIEDDVVVGVEGPEVLTASIPKQPDEIEALVGTAALNL